MSICEHINLNQGGFIVSDDIYIQDVYHITINYTYNEVTLGNKENRTIGVISNPKEKKECMIFEKKIENECSVDNYIEKCLIKDGNFRKVI